MHTGSMLWTGACDETLKGSQKSVEEWYSYGKCGMGMYIINSRRYQKKYQISFHASWAYRGPCDGDDTFTLCCLAA